MLRTQIISNFLLKTSYLNNGLQVTIQANQKVVNLLDVTFDLNAGLYKPFMKDNDQPLYVNSKSNNIGQSPLLNECEEQCG